MIKLEAGAVHLWVTSPEDIQDATLLETYKGFLDEDEAAQEQRFYFERHRHRYLVTHAMVRWVLSQYAECPPEDWRFSKNRYGRPEILASSAVVPPLRFNLSHAEGLAVCAVTLESDIGVDVEYLPRRADLRNIATHFFAPRECEALEGLDTDALRRLFFDIWTLKEAYIKGRGMGLAIPLDEFCFDVGPPIEMSVEETIDDDPCRWRFALLRLQTEHQIALAVADGHGPPVMTVRRCVPCDGEQEIEEEQWQDLRLSRPSP
ncbi:MAG: 4'-phosphopantetheinyl transferase family protein [Bradymonadaceae bacterium]